MSVTFNFRNANQSVDYSKLAKCDANATIVKTTSTYCSIQITATGEWYNKDGSSPYYIHSPGVLVDFAINNQSAGNAINLMGNAAPKAGALDHISATIAWEYANGYAKFWDSSKNKYTITSNLITINRTSSAQTIAWSAIFFPSMDNVKKHATGWTVSGTLTIPALAPSSYTISYDANGGSGAPPNQTVTGGTNFTISSQQPVKANTNPAGYKVTFNSNGGTCTTTDLTASRTTSYTFTSWNTAANGTGTTYNANTTYSTNANLTLYAQYSSSTTTSAITLPVATRTGHTFLGWSASSSATSGSTGSYTPTGATTLYAVWSINSYDLYINLDGGTWDEHTSDQTISLNYGSAQSMPVPTKTGYTFGGWAWTAYGTMDKSKFACSVLSYEPAHNISVYNNRFNGAVTHTYVSGSSDKGKYDNDHIIIRTTGDASPGLGGFYQTVTSEYNSEYYHVFYAKLPVGYYFTYHNNELPTGSSYEWLTDNTGSGQWQIYAYKLTTGSSGSTGTFGFIAANANAGSPTTVTWYLGANQITKSPTSSQTFTAGEGNTWIFPLWIPNRYSVTYNGNGATSGSMSNSTATYNSGFRTKQNTFVRPGYKMIGWNEMADGTGTWWRFDQPGTYESGQDWNWIYTKNIDLYAQWEFNGAIHIWNGSEWVSALPFIYTGTTKSWIQAIPYIYINNTDRWKSCGG